MLPSLGVYWNDRLVTLNALSMFVRTRLKLISSVTSIHDSYAGTAVPNELCLFFLAKKTLHNWRGGSLHIYVYTGQTSVYFQCVHLRSCRACILC